MITHTQKQNPISNQQLEEELTWSTVIYLGKYIVYF